MSNQRYTEEEKRYYAQEIIAERIKIRDVMAKTGATRNAVKAWEQRERFLATLPASAPAPASAAPRHAEWPTGPKKAFKEWPAEYEGHAIPSFPATDPGKTIMVIPDAHATPEHHNARFSLLGKMIVDRKPDIIVNIGDHADMQSLSSYDVGKRSFEGRRYERDIEVAVRAQELIFAPIDAYNAEQRAAGKPEYKPRLVLTLGNHEDRINRATKDQPQFHGKLGIHDLQYERFGWEVVPFLEPIVIQGISFAHYHTSGVMGRPISGENPARMMITKRLTSCIAGHSHLRDFCERVDANGKRVLGLVVGCFLDEDQHEDYAGQANKLWWKGIVMLHNARDGQYDPEFVGIAQMRRLYG